MEGSRAARLWRAEDARTGETAHQEAQVSPCHSVFILARATSSFLHPPHFLLQGTMLAGTPQARCCPRCCGVQRMSQRAFQVDVGFSFTSSPSLLCSVPARCSAAAAFQPRGGCIAVVAAGGEHIAGVPPTPPTMPYTSCCFPPVSILGCHTDLKQEGTEGKAGPGVASLLQNVQQLLVQILQTSRQQQALLESLASDTVSHLQLLSHSLVQVGETLHQLLLRPQTHSGPLSHYISHVPLFEGGPGMPCSPGTPHTSPDCKEEPQLSRATSCTPP
ncbi:uncharacterized protein LOC108640507 isoform X3 [Manacus vitellinus]|uniref:uncharacterized protein LOC108640507 isoform X3 n=1 Tax=Manacus vitellinus TaxID=328815 RepID=UPI000847D3C4|nr:uncharacterized protein LOC108640507 isoform X3 [Manacus vitellinus]